jgi:hypothetical protein
VRASKLNGLITGGARIFRTWGWPVLIVSEELKQAMEQEGITGTRFTEV